MVPVRRKVCLFGVDGVRADIALTERGMPWLAELADAGRRHEMTVEPPTLSGPSWSTILTGASYPEHGVLDNSFVGKRLAAHPDLLSRAFYADQTTTTFAAASWPPLVAAGGLGPVVHERREQAVAGLHRVVVRDGETNGYPEADGQIMAQARWMLVNEGPDVNFVYFCSADDAGHLHGARSDEYGVALALVDSHLRTLTECIAARAESRDEDWLLVVTTDHGHLDSGGHGGASDEERASFVVTHRFGRPDVEWPDRVEPAELTPLILDYLNQ
ncbi:Type I phosphodiesterase / nucleotide pyrophosphatase [Rhodococcus tukisamuensis]|uniref:Type I phosphodiesterase / nucleotide pyrophosphatase n=1 Tax=Rhodococcus tukisamuensis TaxID=168276 RepID=A0A1G6WI43_9NOCA|nr:Type I phosphodiesterase / nucleotide pyrophosphatase [Rhodococcus tukisamuensis]